MTPQEQREAARQFYYRWKGIGQEDKHTHPFWIDIIQNIFGITDLNYIDFEKRVYGEDGNVKRIDGYIAETKVLIEQKSLDIALDKPQQGHNGDTPYRQAWRYNSGLPVDEKARYIITSNFKEIWIYDMSKAQPEKDIQKIYLEDLQSDYYRLEILVKHEAAKITKEMEVSMQAGELVGMLYDELYKSYAEPNEETLKSLNKLCVRLVFCMYAEDAGLFGKRDMFHDYLVNVEPKKMRRAIKDLFRILNTPEEQRDPDEDEDLRAFPYVNGGLFEDDDISIPQFTEELKHLLLEKASNDFDWSHISPTIFGAIFESTLNPETRRSGGMHYTSIENIHKVIDPLFLDELKAELEEILKKNNAGGARTKALKTYQDKLASLKFLDPAAGSGNFLTESYISLRRLENKVLKELKQYVDDGQMMLSFAAENYLDIKVSIQQFYGIEINDFAVTVAKTALWIAESQMMMETLSIADVGEHFLPLKTYVNIVEGNALRIDWNDVLPKEKCSYIMGNPPFVGYSYQSASQKDDLNNLKLSSKNIDYVAAWYYVAAEYMKNNDIKSAFVSTNSVCQGEQVVSVWKKLVELGLKINFAHTTFIWDSEAHIKAHVHCVVVGFSYVSEKKKCIYANNEIIQCSLINPYLIAAPLVFIDKRKKPICKVSEMVKGSQPTDGGNLLLSASEKNDLVNKYPLSSKYIKRFVGSEEFINNKERYCLWFEGENLSDAKTIKPIMDRLSNVREMRLSSSKEATRKWADSPMCFTENRQPKSDYLLIPRVSSERRRYIPVGYMSKDVICSDAVFALPDASLYEFGILNSNVHNAWMRTVAGRLKSDYRYSNTIVYNNFPWSTPTEEQRKKIEQTAQGILDARALYPDSSLADLYDPLLMPKELRDAHTKNDIAVMKAYGFNIKEMSEVDCVAALMKMYQEMTEK